MSARHLSNRIFIALVAAIAWTAALLLDQPAQALPTTFWTGYASCTVQTTSGTYTDQQNHRWDVVPLLITSAGPFIYPSVIWTVTGTGSNSSTSWTYSGRAYGYFQFVVVGTELHISRGAQLADLTGVHVSDESTE